MKKVLWFFLAAMLLLTSVTAGAEGFVNDWSILPDSGSDSDEGVSVEYSDILSMYYDVLDDLSDPELAEETRANEEFRDQLFAIDSGKFGYLLKDIDGDGSVEMIIATMVPEDPYYGKMVLLMLTNDGEYSSQVLASAERSRYYYAGENKFAYVGSNGAADSLETTYAYENGELKDLTVVTPEADYVQLELEEITIENE